MGRESRRVMCTLMHSTSFADWFLARPLLPDVAGQIGGRETLRGSIWVISVFPSSSSPFFFALELPFLRHGRCTPVPLSHRSLLFAAGARPGNSSAYLLPALIQLLISTRCLLFLVRLSCSSLVTWRESDAKFSLKKTQFLKEFHDVYRTREIKVDYFSSVTLIISMYFYNQAFCEATDYKSCQNVTTITRRFRCCHLSCCHLSHEKTACVATEIRRRIYFCGLNRYCTRVVTRNCGFGFSRAFLDDESRVCASLKTKRRGGKDAHVVFEVQGHSRTAGTI